MTKQFYQSFKNKQPLLFVGRGFCVQQVTATAAEAYLKINICLYEKVLTRKYRLQNHL